MLAKTRLLRMFPAALGVMRVHVRAWNSTRVLLVGEEDRTNLGRIFQRARAVRKSDAHARPCRFERSVALRSLSVEPPLKASIAGFVARCQVAGRPPRLVVSGCRNGQPWSPPTSMVLGRVAPKIDAWLVGSCFWVHVVGQLPSGPQADRKRGPELGDHRTRRSL